MKTRFSKLKMYFMNLKQETIISRKFIVCSYFKGIIKGFTNFSF